MRKAREQRRATVERRRIGKHGYIVKAHWWLECHDVPTPDPRRPMRKPLACSIRNPVRQVKPIRFDAMPVLRGPRDHRFHQQAIGASDVEPGACAIEGSRDHAPLAFPGHHVAGRSRAAKDIATLIRRDVGVLEQSANPLVIAVWIGMVGIRHWSREMSAKSELTRYRKLRQYGGSGMLYFYQCSA